MTSTEILADGFGRVRAIVRDVLDGMSAAELDYRPDRDANSVSWLVWHLTRVQDDHIAHAGGLSQVWFDSWHEQFGFPFAQSDIGYGHSSDQVAFVRAPAELLADYHDAVYEQTIRFLDGLTEADMAKIVDRRWDPPVTMAVRLVSVLDDDLEHVGQAAYVRGLVERRR